MADRRRAVAVSGASSIPTWWPKIENEIIVLGCLGDWWCMMVDDPCGTFSQINFFSLELKLTRADLQGH